MLSPSLHIPSLCWGSEQHIALHVKPKVFRSITLNQQKVKQNAPGRKMCFTQISLLTLNHRLYLLALKDLLPCVHYSIFKWRNSTPSTKLPDTKQIKKIKFSLYSIQTHSSMHITVLHQCIVKQFIHMKKETSLRGKNAGTWKKQEMDIMSYHRILKPFNLLSLLSPLLLIRSLSSC